ncbi:MAG TPA: hypothetical protein VMH22_10130 [bacterium]|nr:hypothetical protein [bacterium]
MFGRKVACAASICALWSLLVAGEARTLPGSNHRTRSQYSNYNHIARVLRGEHQAVWPPRRPIAENRDSPSERLRRTCPGHRRNEQRGTVPVFHGGRFDDAFMVDTGVVLGPASGSQYCYGAASNGNGWRVMWSDDNNYSVRTSGIGTGGSLLDPQGSLVGQEQYSYTGLTRSITGTGSGFIAVWTSGYDDSIWAARLDSAGTPLDSFLVWASDSGQNTPAVAFDGDSTCLVVWTENPYGNSDIYASRVTTGGRVLDTVPFPVAKESLQYEMTPTVAFGHGLFLVAWTAYDTISATAKATRVSRTGSVLGRAIFLRHDPASIQAFPSLAFGDTCFLASWAEGTAQPDIYAARVSVSGNLVDTTGIQLCSGPTYDEYPSVGFDGTRYLVMWCALDTTSYRGSLRGRRMTVDGVPLDSGLIRPDAGGFSCEYPGVAADHANFLVAFSEYDTLSYDYGVSCTRISPGGAVLDSGIFFPLGPDAQSGPSSASNGTDYFAAWLESADQGSAVSAARISAGGIVLDPVGFPVNDAPGNKQSLATGFGDSLYLVAWADYRSVDGSTDIWCARVDSNGTVLDSAGIVVCAATGYQDQPDISFDGQNFLVVWQDYRSGMTDNIYAARVSPAGVVLDPGGFVVAAADTFDDVQPAVCFSGSDFLVTWPGTNTNAYGSRVYGALVSPAGQVTKPRFVVGGADNYQTSPSVARGPSSSLVAWEDDRSGYSSVYAARVRADGTVPDPNGIFMDSTGYTSPSPRVTSSGSAFKVLWRRQNYAGDTTYFVAAQVDTAGNVVRKGDWFGLPGYDDGFDAVYGSGPDLLLLFSCYTDTAMGHYYGVDRLWGTLGVPLGIQHADSRQLRKTTSGATVIHGVLVLGAVDSRQQTVDRTELLDAAGRKVAELHTGTNDVSRLSPGVYFVRAESRKLSAASCRKVVIAR